MERWVAASVPLHATVLPVAAKCIVHYLRRTLLDSKRLRMQSAIANRAHATARQLRCSAAPSMFIELQRVRSLKSLADARL
jgi:hypothetical protein